MKKDNIRDYAVCAFRYYASLSCPKTKEAARFALQRQNLTRGLSSAELRASDAELLDLYAVLDTIAAISKMNNGDDILDTLKNVYFTNPETTVHRGEIENRVLFTSYKSHISSATAYRYLALCRRTFAQARGLRLAA